MEALNKTYIDATTPHLMPRAAVSKDLKAIGGQYDVKDEGGGKKSVTASYIVDTDSDSKNGYVVVKASASYEKNKTGNGYTLVSGSGKMEAMAKNITPQSVAALEKYAKFHTGKLLADKTQTMAEAMKILIPTFEAKVGDVPPSGYPRQRFEVSVTVNKPARVVVKLDGVELYAKEVTAGETKMQLQVPETMTAGDKNLTIEFLDSANNNKPLLPIEPRKMKITERVDANMDSQFPKLSAVTIKDIKSIGKDVKGATVELVTLEAKKEMMEVTVVKGNAFVKEKREMLVPTGKTIGDPVKYPKTLDITAKGQKIELARNLDEKNLYKAQIKNAAGEIIWDGEFSIGSGVAPGVRKRGAK